MADTAVAYAPGTVVSADGTTIGYRRLGDGPGLVLVSGGYLAAEHYMELAQALSGTFTVYVLDRRGRGRSGPPGEKYCMARECEDLGALLAETGTRLVFGHSSGGLIALQAALTTPGISRIAVFEPALSMYGAFDLSWIPRFEREMDRDDIAAAMVTFVKGVKAERLSAALPRWLLKPALSWYFRSQRDVHGPGEKSVPDLIPLQRYDVRLFAEMAGSEGFAGLRAQALLMDGVRTPPPLHRAVEALQATLPHAVRVTMDGVGHEAPLNGRGAPERVAAELRTFFTGGS
ncbi:alpha/beta fold hydrolase [Nonomuraea zeae]|uniref:Alpha/beta hydrolase n=1 Tax=Nonomuraea zeae TaxID=1642303 RepID=A0A5S4G717_9ACTN|nr:alpha/beta hydrolase [Nonomuraea zeae]TMR28294.1 alpha/beta hydrolase [Nonomuraea zeae]